MNDYSNVAKLISAADAIIIGAGSGLSTSAGIDYGLKNFKHHFPELVKKYGMTDMYTSSFYHFQTEEERWSYWAKHIDHLYNVEATDTYQKLYNILKHKNYFVITTNVDGQFLKAGFDKNKVFEVQGSLAKIQCATSCHNRLYPDLDIVKQMRKLDQDTKVPTSLVPICPVCKGKMEVNLRKDAFFVEDEHWHQLQHAYEQFINQYKDKKLLLIELGVGFNTPGIIRFPFEQMTATFKDTTLIRVNDTYLDVAFEIRDKTILIQDDCDRVISEVNHDFKC